MQTTYVEEISVRPIISSEVKRTSETIIAVCCVFIILLFIAIAIVIALVSIPTGKILYGPQSSGVTLAFPKLLETTPLLTTNTVQTYIMPGGNCNSTAECVPNAYCNGDNICAYGRGKGLNANCWANAECLTGYYCSGAFNCLIGEGWNAGGPCEADGNCAQNNICVNNVCQPISYPAVFGVFTKVPIYRKTSLINSIHLTDLYNPVPGDALYNGGNPVYYGCVESGPNRIPIYQWVNVLIDDYVLSRSNVQPFKSGTNGYVLDNLGNPIMYIFDKQLNRTFPLYVLEGFQTITDTKYHVCWPNSTIYPNQQFIGNSVIYEQNVDSNDPIILGYIFLE